GLVRVDKNRLEPDKRFVTVVETKQVANPQLLESGARLQRNRLHRRLPIGGLSVTLILPSLLGFGLLAFLRREPWLTRGLSTRPRRLTFLFCGGLLSREGCRVHYCID